VSKANYVKNVKGMMPEKARSLDVPTSQKCSFVGDVANTGPFRSQIKLLTSELFMYRMGFTAEVAADAHPKAQRQTWNPATDVLQKRGLRGIVWVKIMVFDPR